MGMGMGMGIAGVASRGAPPVQAIQPLPPLRMVPAASSVAMGAAGGGGGVLERWGGGLGMVPRAAAGVEVGVGVA